MLLCIDLPIGKVDYSSLSEQTFLEMLIEGFDKNAKRRYQDSDGLYLNARQWPNVRCDNEKGVFQISIDQGFLKWGSRPPKGVARPSKGGRGRPKIGKTGNP